MFRRPKAHDPSIEFEPHLASAPVVTPPVGEVHHTVWDEPNLSPELTASAAEDRLTYSRWLTEREAETSFPKSMWVTLGVAIAAGPFGVLGAFWNGVGGGLASGGLIAVTIVGPVTEELTKIALALWVIERRPYLFKKLWQVLLAATAGGLMFGLIENLIYLNVYIPNHSPSLARFRWGVCTGLHINCSFLCGVGLARMWDHALRNRVRPQIGYALPWMGMAMVGHGLYNLTVTLGELTGLFSLSK